MPILAKKNHLFIWSSFWSWRDQTARRKPVRIHWKVYAWTRLTEDDNFGKKNHLFRWSHFDLGGYVNKQNCRIWGTGNQHTYIEKPPHPKWVTFWCRFWSTGINGAFFFENDREAAVTVNGDRYRAMLNEFLFTKIEEKDIGNIWFQEDGATLDVLRPVFEDSTLNCRSRH